MTEVDTRGLSCPIPVIETKKALKAHPEGVSVLVDTVAPRENVSRFASAMGYSAKISDIEGGWRIDITK